MAGTSPRLSPIDDATLRRSQGDHRRMAADSMIRRTRVDLPDDVQRPLLVFVNGVSQRPGDDYEQIGRSLYFARELQQEGRLGLWRWALIFFGIAGTYRPDDWVDVVYELDGRRNVKTRLPLAA